MQVRVHAIPVESYKVNSNGEEITMVSMCLGAKSLYCETLEVKTLPELEATLHGIFRGLIDKDCNQQFSLRVTPLSRKIRGYDSQRWNRDHTN